MENVYSGDLVVLGAGIAGLVAATSAAEAGLDTLLIEKTSSIGGSSAMSGGFFAFSETEEQRAAGVEDSAQLFRKDLLEVGGHQNDSALLDSYLNNQDETYRWLKDHGVSFSALELSSGQSRARSHHSEIKKVLSSLHRAFTAAGGRTFVGHRASGLEKNSAGRVDAVIAQSVSGQSKFIGRAGVVLATGGFSRGEDLLRIFAPEQLAAIPYGGIGNTGDGLKMGWSLGAGMADMGYISATYGSHPDTGIEFHELLTAYYMGAIIVNKDGRRFVDESQSYKTLGSACLKQPDGLGFEVFDSQVRAKSHPGVPLSDIDMLENLGHVYKAETIEELAVVAGLNAEQLGTTIQEYNEAVAGPSHDEFNRTALCNGVGELLSIERSPFYAYPAKSLMTSTYCGLTITPRAEVTNVEGEIIQGLYAAGEVIGGFHGAAYMTGTSLGKGAIFGRLAAESAQQSIQHQLKA